MRIVGGLLRGRRLRSVPGTKTRPPLARVRAAVANIVAPMLPGAAVLDLFAGTGSYSIELLSRGAASAVCVEKEPRAVATIRENVSALGLTHKVKIICGDALTAICNLGREGQRFDIIIVAPPYFTGLDREAMNRLGTQTLINPGGLVLLQHHRKEHAEEHYGALVAVKRYSYGDTRITTYALAEESTHSRVQ